VTNLITKALDPGDLIISRGSGKIFLSSSITRYADGGVNWGSTFTPDSVKEVTDFVGIVVANLTDLRWTDGLGYVGPLVSLVWVVSPSVLGWVTANVVKEAA
jgi:hypothetical protein